jgi:hypothetical protein
VNPQDLLNAYESGLMSKTQLLHFIIPDKGYYMYYNENNESCFLKTVKDYKKLGFDEVEDDYYYENEEDEISQALDPWDVEDDEEDYDEEDEDDEDDEDEELE